MVFKCKPAKELRFRSWIVLGVQSTVQPLKGHLPRGLVGARHSVARDASIKLGRPLSSFGRLNRLGTRLEHTIYPHGNERVLLSERRNYVVLGYPGRRGLSSWIVLCRFVVADLGYEALGHKLNELRYELIIICLGRFELDFLVLGNGGGSGSGLSAAQRNFKISAGKCAWLQPESQGDWLFMVGGGRFVQSSPRPEARFLRQPALESLKRSARTETPRNGDRNKSDQRAAAAGGGAWAAADGVRLWRRGAAASQGWRLASREPTTIVASISQYRTCPSDHGKAPSTSPHDPLGITDSAFKNQLVVVSVQYGPFNPYIPIRSTTIGKSRVARDPIAMHTSWRSNSDIASVTRVSMTFRVVRTNQYNQDLGLIHSTNGNHFESPNEGSSIDHQVTIYLHAQNITMFLTNETWYFASQILVSSSGGLILILTAQSTRN
ncbi:triacylglycerol lipase [Dorcoceras hygrometricum]|uniref:Triacylglycerol lipase n=1 Tax=Dorcoceras hygrometricum TaxID=472368 RepID=A0A2Z7BT31_9LAMI|nr:triacylglycerol lipase [Dorcoceras hygrometricum]